MVLSRLPIAVAPAQQETVASYLTRLANLHGLPLRELWEPISAPRPGSRRRDVLADRLAAVTGHRREHLVRAPRRSTSGSNYRAAFRDSSGRLIKRW
jgi:TniQ